MLLLKVFLVSIFLIDKSCSMYYLTNFHHDYPDARVINTNCGDTISLSCRTDPNTNQDEFSATAPAMWFRLYENAYPQPLILGDRQLIDDQRFMLRTLNNDRHLEIVGARKDDQGYYICKKGNTIQSSYNLTIATNTCINIIPSHLHVNINEIIHLVCRIRSTDAFNEQNIRVQWTRNDYPIIRVAEYFSNYSSIDGTLNERFIIRRAQRTDTGIYACRYGPLLVATARVIVNQNPGGSKSRRLISQISGNSSPLEPSLRTVVCFSTLYTILFLSFYRK